MTATFDQPRLVQPSRQQKFCPGRHCARACGANGASACHCKPCRPMCPDCLARAQKARRGRLANPHHDIAARQPRLPFSTQGATP